MAGGSAGQFTEVAEVYDSLMSVVPYSGWVEYVRSLWHRYGMLPRRVLDLACGTGSVLHLLQGCGYEVVGADGSEAMLRVARRKLPPEIRLYRQDMRGLNLPDEDPFDSCLCLFDSLNYLLERADLRRAFAGVRRHLRPGGLFVFDMNAIRALETGMFDQRGTGEDAALQYDWRSAWDPVRRICTIEMEFRVAEPGGVRIFHETHVQRGYTQEEIRLTLEEAGFEVAGLFQAYTAQPPTARSDRLHLVAARPDR